MRKKYKKFTKRGAHIKSEVLLYRENWGSIMKSNRIIIFSLLEECLLILFIALANKFNNIMFYFFYNVCYGLLVSTILPLVYILKNKEDFSSVGIKKIGVRQIVVLIAFLAFSVGGQLIPKIAAGEDIQWSLLPICVLPLIMTTFFEEFLFRGFVQTRVEKKFGSIIAILTSAAMFSVYHLGYPGFRNFEDILLLFAVGLGFAFAYKLSDNNLIVSYFVNLPNAFVTYIFKSKQFPVFTKASSVYALISVTVIAIIMLYGKRKVVKNEM